MNTTFADHVITFNENLNYIGNLPEGFDVLNPYLENPETLMVMQKFYHKYYNDSSRRKFIIGINPSRHGAGVTGVPFTDTKRLESVCGIKMESAHTHEISSVFMYDMMESYGGADLLQRYLYQLSISIGYRKENKNGWLNANYYDDKNFSKR